MFIEICGRSEGFPDGRDLQVLPWYPVWDKRLCLEFLKISVFANGLHRSDFKRSRFQFVS